MESNRLSYGEIKAQSFNERFTTENIVTELDIGNQGNLREGEVEYTLKIPEKYTIADVNVVNLDDTMISYHVYDGICNVRIKYDSWRANYSYDTTIVLVPQSNPIIIDVHQAKLVQGNTVIGTGNINAEIRPGSSSSELKNDLYIIWINRKEI